MAKVSKTAAIRSGNYQETRDRVEKEIYEQVVGDRKFVDQWDMREIEQKVNARMAKLFA